MNKLSKSKDKKTFFIETHEFRIGQVCGKCNGKGEIYDDFDYGDIRCEYCEGGTNG